MVHRRNRPKTRIICSFRTIFHISHELIVECRNHQILSIMCSFPMILYVFWRIKHILRFVICESDIFQKSGLRWNLQKHALRELVWDDLWQFPSRNACFEICEFWVRISRKVCTNNLGQIKKISARDSHSLVVTCRILQNTLIMRVWLAICSVSCTIKQVFGFVIFKRMFRKVCEEDV